jgi:Molybdopterin-binding domain of aldehyde dehydrogenase
VTLYDSNQGATRVQETVATAFGLDPANVRVVAPHVGGGFGSKGWVRPHVILAAMAARLVDRPVKVAVTRQQMFALTGYRTPTIQRVRLGCDRDGRLTAIAHDVVEQSSTVREFAEQTAVATRMMYAAPNRRTTHRLARLDVPTPFCDEDRAGAALAVVAPLLRRSTRGPRAAGRAATCACRRRANGRHRSRATSARRESAPAPGSRPSRHAKAAQRLPAHASRARRSRARPVR